MHRYQWHHYVRHSLVCLLSCLALAATDPLFSAGTLTWRDAGVPPTFSSTVAIGKAADYLGIPIGVPTVGARFVQVTDSTPNGNVKSTVYSAWKIDVYNVTLNNPSGSSTNVDVSLFIHGKDVDGAMGLAGAYILGSLLPPSDALNQQSKALMQAAARDGWNLSRPANVSDDSNGGLTRLLNSLWADSDLEPGSQGLWFIKPLSAAPALPMQASTRRPLLPPGSRYWIAQIMAAPLGSMRTPALRKGITATPANFPLTGRISLYDENRRAWVRSISIQ
ncbi:hypothetical protein [Chitinimonas sp. JJ19]|uniref:hypothetical protein n=1 Tax=Chitinimonas sp. JJ19 TaxID=3109352 RepID=UPI0030009336